MFVSATSYDALEALTLDATDITIDQTNITLDQTQRAATVPANAVTDGNGNALTDGNGNILTQ